MKQFAKAPDSVATELLEAHLNDSISEKQGQELVRRLKEDANFRAFYIDSIGLDAAMQREFEYFTDTSLIKPVIDSNTRSTKKSWFPWIAAAAAVVITGLTVSQFRNDLPKNDTATSKTPTQQPIIPKKTTPEETGHQPVSRPKQRTIARLISSEDAVWSDKHKNLTVGTWLKPGIYELTKGTVSIEFDSGTTFELVNNAKIELNSRHKGKIISGEVITNIPFYNTDFQVELPNGIVTEEAENFSVKIHKDKSVDFQIIAGAASLKQKDKLIKTITSNEKIVRFDKMGKISVKGCFAKARKSPKRKYVTRNYVHYRFDSIEPSGFVADEGTYDHKKNGQLISQNIKKMITKGVYGNALYFNGYGALLETPYKGVSGNKPRTVAFWVKIPEGTKSKNSYSMATWGKVSKGHKWQICWNFHRAQSSKIGALRAEFGMGYAIGTKDLRDDKWHHVAIVYLGGPASQMEKNIKFYVDGKIDPISSSRPLQINTKTHLNTFSVGKILDGSDPAYHRGFKGWLDEMYVFEAALSPHQVRKLFKSNIAPARNRFIPSVVK